MNNASAWRHYNQLQTRHDYTQPIRYGRRLPRSIWDLAGFRLYADHLRWHAVMDRYAAGAQAETVF